MNPNVTVLMTVYNGQAYLREAVESILAQTLTDFEFIIINDGSTDGSPLILDEYTRDDRVRVFHQENQGVAAALNRAIKESRGPYLARMDADDICCRTRLEVQTQFLRDNPSIGVLGSAAQVIDRHGHPVGPVWAKPKTHAGCIWHTLCHSPFLHPTVMMRKDVIEKVGGYSPTFSAQDLNLWCRLYRHTRFHNLPEALLCYRRHETQITQQPISQDRMHGILQSRQLVYSDLLGETVPLDVIAKVSGVQELSTTDAKLVIEILHRLWSGFRRTYPAEDSEYSKIRQEFVRHVLRIGRVNPVMLGGMMLSTWEWPDYGLAANLITKRVFSHFKAM